MTIFKNVDDKQLYVIDHLIRDIYHTNGNAFRGFYRHALYTGKNTKIEPEEIGIKYVPITII